MKKKDNGSWGYNLQDYKLYKMIWGNNKHCLKGFIKFVRYSRKRNKGE